MTGKSGMASDWCHCGALKARGIIKSFWLSRFVNPVYPMIWFGSSAHDTSSLKKGGVPSKGPMPKDSHTAATSSAKSEGASAHCIHHATNPLLCGLTGAWHFPKMATGRAQRRVWSCLSKNSQIHQAENIKHAIIGQENADRKNTSLDIQCANNYI